MRSILVLLEDLVRTEFGATELAEVRSIASERGADAGRLHGPVGKVMAFAEAIAQVRRRPVPEVYTFIGLKLVQVVIEEQPALVRGYSSTTGVLMQASRLAGPLADALLPGAEVPHFDLELADAETQRVTFTGASELASIVEGVILGLAVHFGEKLVVRRQPPPTYAPQRRLIDVQVIEERRSPPDDGGPRGTERRRALKR